MRRMPVRAAAILAVVVLLLSGCSAGRTTTRPTVDLDVLLFQYRSDYAPRQMQIEVHNSSSTDITVTKATFSSAWFAHSVSSASVPSPVFAKGTTDFPVVLAPAACGEPKSAARADISYSTKRGTGHLSVVPTIPFDSLGVVHSQDCSRRAFEAVATIVPAGALHFEQVAGKPIALLDIIITPTGAAGTAVLHSTQDTTLLTQREGQLREFDLRFDAASPPTTITLDFTPGRCEQHVVAEDKVGTEMPFHVDAPGFTDAEFAVPVSPAVKNEFLDWVGVYCGW